MLMAWLRVAEDGREEARRRVEGVACTLCVSTGTRDIGAALAARPEGDSLLVA